MPLFPQFGPLGLICLYCLAFVGLSSDAQEPARATWQAYRVGDGSPFGYRHVRVWELPEGGRRYEVQTRMLIDLLEDAEATIQGNAGRRFAFSRRQAKEQDTVIKTTEFIWVKGNAGFILNLIAAEAEHDALQADLENLLKSFEIADKDM